MADEPSAELHWTERVTTGRFPWSLDGSTASSDEWILDADGNIIGTVFFTNPRDRQAFLTRCAPPPEESMTDEPSAKALSIGAINRATEISSTFEYALNIWERDAIAREIGDAYRRGWERGREDAAHICDEAERELVKDPRTDHIRETVSRLYSMIHALAPPQEGS